MKHHDERAHAVRIAAEAELGRPLTKHEATMLAAELVYTEAKHDAAEVARLTAALEAVAARFCCQESCSHLGDPPPPEGRTCADVGDRLCAVCLAREALTGDPRGGRYRQDQDGNRIDPERLQGAT